MKATDLVQKMGAWRSGRSSRCDCPSCSYPGVFTIRANRAGDAVVRCMNGCAGEDLDKALRQVAGGQWKPKGKPQDTDLAAHREKQRERALREWAGSCTALGTLGDTYLTGRGLPSLAASPALRFRGDATHPEGGRLPALVAQAVDAAGRHVADHRTYLARDGQGKANVTPNKASLGPIWGGAIRLQDFDPAQPLVIGEGIESSASAGQLIGAPAWAAINAGNLAKGLILPPEVRHVIVAIDPDPPGERAAYAAAARWRREGRRVQLARPRNGDFNDILLAGTNHA